MKNLVPYLIIAGVVAVIAGIIYLEVGVWQECRATNSWLYCVRVLGK